ncbi:MAG: hypothetical protein Q7S28_03795 [bacterium]|nr:hypothetical protein [bacterium]
MEIVLAVVAIVALGFVTVAMRRNAKKTISEQARKELSRNTVGNPPPLALRRANTFGSFSAELTGIDVPEKIEPSESSAANVLWFPQSRVKR